MIDSHAHIYLPAFKKDISEVIARAENAGIEKILMPNIDSSSIGDMNKLHELYPRICLPMMGLHPCSVKVAYKQELQLVEQELESGSYIAVGEIGTDLYWDKSLWNEQQEAFKFQCELALRYELPVVIHCRDSIDETINLVTPFAKKGLTGVFHCFTGNVEQAGRISDLGFYLGLGGISTFKNGGMDKVIPLLSADSILLETDSPYLAPIPKRGTRNEPSFLENIRSKVAELLCISEEVLVAKTTGNTEHLFKLSS